ncbi:type I methionyl aminopeptidase [Actinomadura sp. 7K507]|uniref:type I methionyl aminopeptidase n=1 Tax=Actinomadura sp. 7K507 TaxID=2530365 RepID=UPI0014046FF0|nr:type I methionyl aminopeptidase [Actinomadura sp. 7K507]
MEAEDGLDAVRRAGTLVATALERSAAGLTASGPTLADISAAAQEHLAPARPSFLGYRGFPAACDIAVNEVVCHGFPDDRTLAPGDLVTLALAGNVDGMHSAAATSHVVPGAEDDGEAVQLVERGREALRRAVTAVRPGRQINVVGRVIESYARRFGYGVVRDFGGHGIGAHLHQDPFVPGHDAPAAVTVISEGMIFTVQVMLTLGSPEIETDAEGWNVATKDRTKTAAFCDTVLVTATGTEILTGL